MCIRGVSILDAFIPPQPLPLDSCHEGYGLCCWNCENVTVVLRCYFCRRHLPSRNLYYHQNCHVKCNQQMLFKVSGFSCYTLYCSGLNLYTYLTWSRCRLSPFFYTPLSPKDVTNRFVTLQFLILFFLYRIMARLFVFLNFGICGWKTVRLPNH